MTVPSMAFSNCAAWPGAPLPPATPALEGPLTSIWPRLVTLLSSRTTMPSPREETLAPSSTTTVTPLTPSGTLYPAGLVPVQLTASPALAGFGTHSADAGPA